jgi:hypothetical protein
MVGLQKAACSESSADKSFTDLFEKSAAVKVKG